MFELVVFELEPELELPVEGLDDFPLLPFPCLEGWPEPPLDDPLPPSLLLFEECPEVFLERPSLFPLLLPEDFLE